MSAPDEPRRPMGRRTIDALPKAVGSVLLLLIGSVATSEVPKLLAGRSIKLDPPVGLKLSKSTYHDEYDPNGNPPAASLAHLIGLEFQSNVSITGYDGRQLLVICTASDQRTGQSATTNHMITGGSNRTTQPCWLPLPGPASDTYTVQVAIAYPNGDGNLAEAFATIPG